MKTSHVVFATGFVVMAMLIFSGSNSKKPRASSTRSNTQVQTQITQPSTAPSDASAENNAAHGGAYCKDYASQPQAQEAMQNQGQSQLDRDKDGVACELLPSNTQPTMPNNAANHASAAVAAISTALAFEQSAPHDIVVKVIEVIDGDTLRVQDNDGRIFDVRLYAIDAPERHQSYGTQSSDALKQLCDQQEAVITPQAIDKYKRVVAKVKCAQIPVAEMMVSNGDAWVFDKYVGNEQQLYPLQQKAQAQQFGLWAEVSPQAPWEWRAQPSVLKRYNR